MLIITIKLIEYIIITELLLNFTLKKYLFLHDKYKKLIKTYARKITSMFIKLVLLIDSNIIS